MANASAERTREQALAALNQAALAITRQLDLTKTLQQIVESACSLVNAKYAALGVPNSEGQLITFLHSGVPDETVAAIGETPHGRGLLGAILQEGRTIRIPRISDDPRSVGFPPNHPPMVSFLGVPIYAKGHVLGNLYLTDKIAATEFSKADQKLIEILATHAAIAITNAHLFQDTVARSQELQARNQELAALNAIARAIGQHVELDKILAEALDQVVALMGVTAARIFLRDEVSGDMVLASHRGLAQTEETVARFSPGKGFPGKVAQNWIAPSASELGHAEQLLRRQLVAAGYRSFVTVPLIAQKRIVGALDLATRAIREFEQRELRLLESIGNQIGVAVENARLYEQVGRLAVIDERARIGMDLHDGVIQSIYAVGLTLESAQLLLSEEPGTANTMIAQAIEGLNDAIRDIRNYILDLRPQRYEGDLGPALARLVREFQANSMVPVTLQAPPEIVAALPTAVGRTVFMAAQEALANVARHARASRVAVSIANENEAAVLTVTDDGRGFDVQAAAQRLGHGLANMRDRAQRLNGTFEISSAPGSGTTLTLTLPLEGDRDSTGK